MADPVQFSCRTKWLRIAIIALLAVLALVWVLGPSGDRDADVDEPIASEERFGVEGAATDLEARNPNPRAFQAGRSSRISAAPEIRPGQWPCASKPDLPRPEHCSLVEALAVRFPTAMLAR